MSGLDRLSRFPELSFTVARRAGSLALSTIRQVADMALERRSQSRTPSTWAPPPPAPAPARPPDPEPAARPAAAAAPAPAVTQQAAEHVDREAVVVAESADEGAADGVGAQIRIGEPWKGYGSLTAPEVNDRLASASPESLAVARLYETANRNRVTVLKEIDRRMQAARS